MDGPLAGVKVVDVTSTFLGPYCTFLMAQLGADVIKIEPPGGDVVRWLTSDGRTSDMSSGFINVNRGKRSVVLDLKDPAAIAALSRIAAEADVFIHNMRPAAAERLGIGYEAVRCWSPSIVYCAAYGYGRGGPSADRPAYDDIIQASSGIAAVQGHADGVPRYVASVIADKTAGLTALYAVLAALIERARTGAGQAIDVPMYETMVAYLLIEQMGGLTFDPPRGPPLYPRTVSPFRRPYRARDGYMGVMVYTDDHWQRFLSAVGRDDLLADPRFESVASRTANIDWVYELLGEILAGRSVNEWLELFELIDVPAAPVKSVEDLFTDPHLCQVGLVESTEHPSEGTIRTVRSPVEFSHGLPRPRPAPRLGEHTFEVLREHGFADEEIASMRASGAYESSLAAEEGASP